MTDSSEDEEENEEEQLCGSGDARKIVHYRNDAYAPSGKTRARFMRMAFLKNKSVWFVCDPCGIVCAVMTYLLVLYGQFVMLTVIAPPFPGTWTVLRVLGFSALGGLAVVAHVRSMLTDPVSILHTFLPILIVCVVVKPKTGNICSCIGSSVRLKNWPTDNVCSVRLMSVCVL